ncbi:hypothetical protein MtrunA17_Chr7g0263811 [Medicago truncatula]|uniref:Transmembrane protein n=1 Tax=Medicago truncatula TaxID=3880 RepID=A0A396H7D1_MEDTR|nr:hypothetical protein MtrunA17_Chr7g0263811 [Medicago truncatula]
MSYMDLRPSIFTTNCFFLFLILTLPYFSRALDTEIYEIDYRGPETHSFVPPPDHSHGKPHSAHDKSSAAATKATGFTGIDHATMKQKVKKFHG